ncbi:MAG: holo-ACP synthase [Leptospiraceae bacterium]|jgi:holo-[acyl-carrier protein] synthase|nr:holo-ACP synthase [Leptospiraceae bacterium]MBK7055551.1 holo-ACP synthase [Leptospiraceae bacterium]MBK9502311.1 holo-ACP synthase [Leptospiraceae bacterium]MBL0263037.1 holo-ACP synthase [Leptospiraceae bacterium]MBP9165673.1 holo-ACP synthase [Leptospiraceae bacterium]
MILSVGNDIVENGRIKDTFDKFGERFLEKVFSKDEVEYCLSKKNPIPHLSARFACKEAFIKAIELENGKALEMKEIELSGNFFGKKNLALHGKARELFLQKGYNEISVSISHTDEYATAVVILYCK